MKYYATVAASSSVVKSQDTVERIERRVLDSNPIMEAFGETTDKMQKENCKHNHCRRSLSQHFPLLVGNACTLRNNNSSRFGKYIQLQLDRYIQLNRLHFLHQYIIQVIGQFNLFNMLFSHEGVSC